MGDTDQPTPPGQLTQRLKQHSMTQVFVDQELEVYGAPLEDGLHALVGVNNIEFVGSVDRLAEMVEAMSQLVQTLRSDPAVMERWRDGGRVGHPLFVGLSRRYKNGAPSTTAEG
jgi:hypothetical protein